MNLGYEYESSTGRAMCGSIPPVKLFNGWAGKLHTYMTSIYHPEGSVHPCSQ